VRDAIFVKPAASEAWALITPVTRLQFASPAPGVPPNRSGTPAKGIPRPHETVKMYIRPYVTRAGGTPWRTKPRSHAARSAESITARQREVLGLIARGLTNKEMGHSLGITERGAPRRYRDC
jgi:hypothetical protein